MLGIITYCTRLDSTASAPNYSGACGAPAAAMKRLPNDDPARLEVVQNEKLLLLGVRVLCVLRLRPEAGHQDWLYQQQNRAPREVCIASCRWTGWRWSGKSASAGSARPRPRSATGARTPCTYLTRWESLTASSLHIDRSASVIAASSAQPLRLEQLASPPCA